MIMETYKDGYNDGYKMGKRHREDPPFRDETGVTDEEFDVISEEHGFEYATGFRDGYYVGYEDHS